MSSSSDSLGRTRRLMVALSALLFALSAPLTLTRAGEVTTNDACALGTCCPSSGDWCNLGGETILHYYYKDSGSCSGVGTGTCCPEEASYCNGGGQNYYNFYFDADGTC